MPEAELVIYGSTMTIDDAQPHAEGVAVSEGRLVAVGSRAELSGWVGDSTEVVDISDGCLLPGLIEAHGHPLLEAMVLDDRIVDIRPVTIPSGADVVAAVHAEIAARGADGAFLNGWDPLLQNGLPDPTLAWLNEIAPDTPLVIVHNSGHLAFFNSAAAKKSGLDRNTPDPKGSQFGRDADGELDGRAYETGAVLPLVADAIGDPAGFPAMLVAECARLNKAGLTTCSEMAFNPEFRSLLDGMNKAGALTVRLRLYEVSTAEMATTMTPVNGDELLRQVGIKIWVDGSPWVGNIDLTFPYVDSDATRSIGVEPGSCGHANYTKEQLREIVGAYFPLGWPLACHAHGDKALDTILDVYEEALTKYPRKDHRLRLEHCGAMQPRHMERAARLGVTCSFFADHLHYWGDVLVDGLFGPEHGANWMPARSAVNAGIRISLHNDPPVTPEEPLRNISVAATRIAPSGRVLAPDERLTVEQAIRAQTLDAAYQLFADDIIGSLEVGKYADLVVLSADPRNVRPEEIADLEVRATYLAGKQVYRA